MHAKIWLSSPHLGDEELEFVHQAFKTNWIAPLGAHVDGFEVDLQEYNGIAHAAALTSGTAALHIGLDILGVREGDIVLCQTFTFCGSANPITYLGATPVFIDSERDTWNMDPNLLLEAIEHYISKGQKPKAIIPVHLYGMPAKMEEIMEIAEKYEIPILEDAAESLGSTYQGRKTGTFGQIGVYSFNGNKIITTSGGGALVSEDQEIVERARYLASQARDDAPHYQHSSIGYNYRLSNVLAGIGRGQMTVLDTRVEQRRRNFERYQDYFEKWRSQGVMVHFQPESPHSFSNRWLTCLTIDPSEANGLSREEIRLKLEEKNIEARPLWKPMHLQPVFEGSHFFGSDVSERLFENGLCLPSGSNLTDEEFDRIFAELDNILHETLQEGSPALHRKAR